MQSKGPHIQLLGAANNCSQTVTVKESSPLLFSRTLHQWLGLMQHCTDPSERLESNRRVIKHWQRLPREVVGSLV